MDWDSFRILVTVAELGSLSAAARQLGTSQPTVGRKITDLEKQLKVRLFQRSSEGYTPTPVGQAVIERAKKIEALTYEIERVAASRDQELSGRVALATTESLAVFWLAAKLPSFRDRYPNIMIELLTSTTKQDLMRGEADLVLRIGDPGSPELFGRKVGAVTFGLFAAQFYLDKHGEPIELCDLNEHNVIEPVGSIADFAQNHQWREVTTTAKVGVACNHMFAALAAVNSGLGLFPLPLLAEPCTPNIKRVLIEQFDVTLDLWLLTHRDLRETARIRAVIDFLVNEVQADRPLFTGKVD